MEEKSHVKALLLQTIIYGLGIMLNKAVGFILLPVYTKYFPAEQMGLFTLIQSLSMFLGAIYMLGMETSFMKFFIDAKDDLAKSEIYSSTIAALTFSSIIFSIILFMNAVSIVNLFGFDNSTESIFLVKILSAYLFIDTLYRFPLLLFRAEMKSEVYALINSSTFIVNIVLSLVLIVFLKKGIESIFFAYMISAAITFIIGIIMTRRYLRFNISFIRIKEMLGFGNKFVYVGFFVLLIDISDRFFLKYFFNEDIVGIYSANYRLASAMGFLIASFKFSWTPYFLNISENPDNKKIISNIFSYFIFAGLFLFLLLSAVTDSAVKISVFGFEFLNAGYWSGLKIVPVILLAYFFSGLYSTLNAVPFFTNRTYAILAVTAAGFILNLIFNFLLIPHYEIMGAAAATMFTYLSMFIIIYFYTQKIYRIDYPWSRILKLAAITFIFFAMCYFGVNKWVTAIWPALILNMLMVVIYLVIVSAMGLIDLKKVLLLWRN